ncbi:MAG: hypothetical protein ACFFF4_12990 [Candidatus Thorarchaeota archaeon]
MQKRSTFALSVIMRIILALLVPIEMISSVGVTTTNFSGRGMAWIFDGYFRLESFSIITGLLYAIPAIIFCIYFRSSGNNSFTKLAALVTSILCIVIPILGDLVIVSYSGVLLTFVPLTFGYSASLILLFIILPFLNSIRQSEEIGLLSHEVLFSLVSILIVLLIPYVTLFNEGLYATGQIMQSSIFITITSIRSGWTGEVTFLYLYPSVLSELNLQLSNFYLVFILRLLLISLSVAYFIGRTSLFKVISFGVFQEVYLWLTTYALNSTLTSTIYFSSGVTSNPFLLPVLIMLIIFHREITESKIPVNEEEYINVPLLVTIKNELNNLKKKLRRKKD